MTRTNRWTGVTALAFAGIALGALLGTPAPLLVAAVGVGYAAYAAATGAPTVELATERELDAETPDPGERVTVEVTVTNVGDATLPDLRLLDGVPTALDVVGGHDRIATALRPGDDATIEYTVIARRGQHAFGPLSVVARDASGTNEVSTTVAAPGELSAVPTLPAAVGLPLRGQTTQQVGAVTTDAAGSGVEFHTVREYRAGDPLTRVDWKRRARTGELTTVDFRQERAATVVFVVDSRQEAYVRAGEGESAVDHAVTAVGAMARHLVGDGHPVGVASFGARWTWLQPGVGRGHVARLRDRLALGDGFSPAPETEPFLFGLSLRRVVKHLPGNAQVVFCSPLADDEAVAAARQIEAHGHAVTVVSPDVTADGSGVGATVARLERRDRVRSLRRHGVRVVDWDVDRSFAVAAAEAGRRWRT